jgi:predicted ATPase
VPPEPENFASGVSTPVGDSDTPDSKHIVGRTTEVESIESVLDAAAQKNGRSIAFTGVAGIGKTFLVSLLKMQAIARQAQVINFTCTNLAHTTPL